MQQSRYAHKDEDHKNALTEHLSPLVRTGLIEEWNDRKLVPGTNWANEISENLQNSTIILFLISSSFLDSDYCIEGLCCTKIS
ncbi:toll/interleukin-1 receptor domain-containing protein [Acinetobacter johnsonii]|uniref:toll/interleukin-1 receptor domain-containing protein n=1 Tax=Acinetobacter johnsonii TaxID=40214 RepID=UPI0032B3B603